MRGNLAVHCYNKSHFEALLAKNVASISACLLNTETSLLVPDDELVRWRAMLCFNRLLETVSDMTSQLFQESARLEGKGMYDAAKQKKIAATAELNSASRLTGSKLVGATQELVEQMQQRVLVKVNNQTTLQMLTADPRASGVVVEKHRHGTIVSSCVKSKALSKVCLSFESVLVDGDSRVICVAGPLDTPTLPDDGCKTNLMIEVAIGTPCTLYWHEGKWNVLCARRFKSFPNPMFNFSPDVLVDEYLFWKFFEGLCF